MSVYVFSPSFALCFFQSCVAIQSSLDQRLCSYQKGRATRGQSSHWLYCLLARALSLILALFPLFYRLYIYRQPVNKCSSCLIMWTCRGAANLSIERNTAERLKMGRDSTVFSSIFSIEKICSTLKLTYRLWNGIL